MTIGAGGGAAAATLFIGGISLAIAAVVARLHHRAQRRTAGLPLTPYMLLAVTSDTVHLLRAGSTWRCKGPIAAWRRGTIRVRAEPWALTWQLVVEVPSDGQTIALEAVKGKPIREVLDALGMPSGL
jgi:hypothetical protein